MLSVLRAAACGLFTRPPASVPISSDPASTFSPIISSTSAWAVGPPAMIRQERSATTIDALAPSSKDRTMRLDQSAEDLVRGMENSFEWGLTSDLSEAGWALFRSVGNNC